MKTFADRNPVLIAIGGLLTLALMIAATFRAEDLPVIGGGTVYTAMFSEAAGLKAGNEVRVAGVKVGKVEEVTLDRDQVRVRFRVEDTWIGAQSTAAIEIKTMLGQKFLSVDPLGVDELDPADAIPVSRTSAPFDVTAAFSGLSDTLEEVDTAQLARSFRVLSATFEDAPAALRGTVEGLSRISRTVASRDRQLASLLRSTEEVSGLLADRRTEVGRLVRDADRLLAELSARRTAVRAMLTGATRLSTQLEGLVADNQSQLRPALADLDRVAAVLDRHQQDLDTAVRMLGPYYRLIGDSLANGPWVDVYLCGLFTAQGTPQLDSAAPRDCTPGAARKEAP